MKDRYLGATMVALFILVLLAGGCARVSFEYRNVVADLEYSGTALVAVAVHDQRPFVKSGRKHPSFVGLIRGGFGNPVSIATKSGNALAEDMVGVTAASLQKKGYKAETVATSPGESKDEVLAKLRGTAIEKFILLTMDDWRTDSFKLVTLIYDLTINIYDKNGKSLAEKRIEGREYLQSASTSNAYYIATRESSQAFKKKLEELLNSPDVARLMR